MGADRVCNTNTFFQRVATLPQPKKTGVGTLYIPHTQSTLIFQKWAVEYRSYTSLSSLHEIRRNAETRAL